MNLLSCFSRRSNHTPPPLDSGIDERDAPCNLSYRSRVIVVTALATLTIVATVVECWIAMQEESLAEQAGSNPKV